jgi:hypothetical protein
MEPHSQERSEEIKNYARANIKSYVTASEEGGTRWWRSIENLSGQVAQEYQGRVLYELIQNASDAHNRAGYAAPVRIRLNRSEGDFGTLYITNGGNPFTRDDFEAINSIAQSSKPPGEGIGNKGLGFRSVLTISTWPEIYSSEPEGNLTGDLNGYCFGFARPEDLVDLCHNDQELIERVSKDLHPMLLPTPRRPVPRQVADLADGRTATVIRLPLRSEEAIRSVERQIKQLHSDEAPLLLFLKLISELSVEIIDSGIIESAETMRRSVMRLDISSAPANTFEIIDLEEKGKFFIASLLLGAEELRSEIYESVQKNYMNERWLDWNEPGSVSVACRIDGGKCLPNIYTFLPMAESAPFAGYLNAPFFTDLGRMGLQLDVPFNEFLFNMGAKLCAATSITLANSDLEFAPSCAVDLIAWNNDHAERIKLAFNQLGSRLMNAPIIPTAHPESGIVWSPIKDVWRWTFAGDYVTSDRLTTIAEAQLVLGSLGKERIDRLHEFIRNWRDWGLDPVGNKKADWFELIASDLSKTRASMSVWNRYYDDFAGVFRTTDVGYLRGRRIFVDSEGTCAPVATAFSADPNASRIAVFFPPAGGSEDDEEDEAETDGAVGLTVPSVLKDRIRFMHSDLTWHKRDGRIITKLYRRRFLEDNNLVRVFRRRDLLEILADTLASSSDKRIHQECLRWAYELFRSSRSSRSIDLKNIPFRIPCFGGLELATETFFSVGWHTKDARELEAFLADAGDVSPELAELRKKLIVHPDDWPFDTGNVATFREFLETAGVRDGLWPDVIRKDPIRETGARFYLGSFRSETGLRPADFDFWWRAVKADWSGPPYSQAQCILVGNIARIPGQSDYEHFPESARMHFAILLARGLARWSNPNFNVIVRRVHGGESLSASATPLGAFLKLAPWVPVARVGDRQSVDYVAPSDAWYCSAQSADPPAFSPYVHHSVRAAFQDNDKALRRFREVGGHDWLAPEDAPDLVRHLTRICRDVGLQKIHHADFRAAYEHAWRECLAPELRSPFTDDEESTQVVAQIGDQFVVVPDSMSDSDKLREARFRASVKSLGEP